MALTKKPKTAAELRAEGLHAETLVKVGLAVVVGTTHEAGKRGRPAKLYAKAN